MRPLVHRALIGAGTFAAVQAFLLVRPPYQPGIPSEHPGWFLNSGEGVIAVMTGLSLAAGASMFWKPATMAASWIQLAAGAILAMTATYVSLGGGTLFPIVVAVGTGCIAVATFLGTSIAVVARTMLTPR